MSTSPDLVVSFDLDHVLLPDPVGRCVFPQVLDDLAQALTDHRTQAHPERSRQALADEIYGLVWEEFRYRLRTFGSSISTYDWDDIFTVVAQRLGLEQRIALVPYIEEFCRHSENLPTYPDVAEGLAQLHRRDIPLLAITNGHARFQVPMLRALGLEPFFRRIATPDRVGSTKRHPTIFHWAYRGWNAQRHVHVGDSLLQDIYGAHQAGLEAVWLRRDLPPDLSILPPSQRMTAPVLRDFWESVLERNESPIEDLARCWPEHVAQDLGELLVVLGLAD